MTTPDTSDVKDLWNNLFNRHYAINSEVKQKNYSHEYGEDLKKHDETYSFFIISKWVMLSETLGFAPSYLSDKLQSLQFDPENSLDSTLKMISEFIQNSPDVAPHLLMLGVSTYITMKFVSKKKLMEDHSENLQSFKSELLDMMKINNNSMITDEMSSNGLHKLYLLGFHTHDSIKEKTIQKIKGISASLQKLWSDDDLSLADKIMKVIKSELPKTKITNFYTKLQDLNDPENMYNKMYTNSQLLDRNKKNNKSKVKESILELNQKAMVLASQTYANQNIQIMFARLVQDIVKRDTADISLIHKKILMKFEDLHIVTELKDSDGKVKSPEAILRISTIANNLLNGTSHFSKNSKLSEIIESINPEMITNHKKIKYGKFETHLIEAKKKIVHNNLTQKESLEETKKDKKIKHDDFNLNVYQDTLINPSDLEKIISIDLDKAKKKMKATKMSSVEKKNKLDELR